MGKTKKPYQLLEEAQHHFVMKHPDGTHFSVAKQGLSEDALGRIRGMKMMAEGGEVTADDVPADPELVADDEAPDQVDRAPASSPVVDQAILQSVRNPGAGKPFLPTIPLAPFTPPGAPPFNARDFGSVDEYQRYLDALRDAGKLPGATPAADDTEPAATTVPASVPPSAQVAAPRPQAAPAAPSAEASAMDLVRKGLGQERGAAAAEANAATEQGKQTAAALQSLATQQAKIQEAYATKLRDYEKQRDELEKSYREGTINPNRYWQNLSTPNRILAGISLVLGGVGQALTKSNSNVALDIINKSIDRDIDAQKQNLGKAHTLLNFNLEKTRDMTQATMQTQSQLLSAAKVQVEMAAAKAQGPVAQARAQAIIGQINQKQAQLEMQLALMHAKNTLVSGAGSVNPELLGKEDRERLVVLPNGRQRLAYSSEGARSVRENLQTVQPIFDQLDELDKLGPSALMPGSKANQRAQAIRATLVPLLNENAGLKRLSEEDIHNLQQQIKDPTSFRQILGGKERSDALREFLVDKLQNVLGQQLEGYKKPFVPKSAEVVAPRVSKR